MLPRYCQVALVYSLKIRELLKSLNAGKISQNDECLTGAYSRES